MKFHKSELAFFILIAVIVTAGLVLVHAYGMLTAKTLAAESVVRMAGAMGTYLFGLALAVAAAFTLV